jgi:predicted membrane-bound spermidine synthase
MPTNRPHTLITFHIDLSMMKSLGYFGEVKLASSLVQPLVPELGKLFTGSTTGGLKTYVYEVFSLYQLRGVLFSQKKLRGVLKKLDYF